MDRSLGTVAQPRIQNVTDQILRSHGVYGCSDNTNPNRTAAGKSLNYADGPTIQNPSMQLCHAVPHTWNYQDSIGLFGAENHYIKFLMTIGLDTKKPYMEEGWEAAEIKGKDRAETNGFWQEFERTLVLTSDEKYESAETLPYQLPELKDMYISVRLENKGTGNIYNDSHIDTRIYTQGREEHPYDLMFIKQNSFFYVGFHARNTKRLSYDVSVHLGEQLVSYDDIEDKRYIMRR